MLDTAFPGQRCIRGLGTKLDKKTQLVGTDAWGVVRLLDATWNRIIAYVETKIYWSVYSRELPECSNMLL